MTQTQNNRDNVRWLNKVTETLQQRYGVENAGQMVDHVKKCTTTLRKHYGEGITNSLQLTYTREQCRQALKRIDVIDRRKACNRERWGHENPFGSKLIQEKIKSTLVQRYGVNHSSRIENIATKRKETYAKTHAYDHPFKDPINHEKACQGCLERYGVRYAFMNPEIRKKIAETCIARYGTPVYAHTEAFHAHTQDLAFSRRIHETMKRNGTYGKSRPEDRMYAWLCETYGSENVERQAFIHRWPIDFYVKNIDTYIQLDGVYWHGLDRPRDIIATSTCPRDKNILRAIDRDIAQGKWFNTQGLRLLRFTDLQTHDQVLAQLLCGPITRL